jgi:hypothetical protein
LTKSHTVTFGPEADQVFEKIDELVLKEQSSQSAVIRRVICEYFGIELQKPRYNATKMASLRQKMKKVSQ